MSHKKCFSTHAFTLIELLVVMAVVVIVVAILVPVFMGVREQGRRTTCLSNLRQIDVALTAYTQDNEGFFPPDLTDKNDWAGVISSYAPAKDVFRCPSIAVPPEWDGHDVTTQMYHAQGYAINSWLYSVSIKDIKHNIAISEQYVRYPSSTVAVAEFAYRAGPEKGMTSYPLDLSAPDDGSKLFPGQTYIGPAGAVRHAGGSNYVFVDGHAHWYRPTGVSGKRPTGGGEFPSFAL